MLNFKFDKMLNEASNEALNERVVVYTGKNFTGDKFTIGVGDFNFDTKKQRTVVGIISKQEYSINYNIEHSNFKNDAINSLEIGPFLKVIIYEDTDKGGRWIMFENAENNTMKIEDLSISKFNFNDKISHIEVSQIKNKNKTYQSTHIVDSFEKEKFNPNNTYFDFKYNYTIILIIVLTVSSILCFILGGAFGLSLSTFNNFTEYILH